MGPFVFVGTKDYATGLLDITSLGYGTQTGWSVGSLQMSFTSSLVQINFVGSFTATAPGASGLWIIAPQTAFTLDAFGGNATVIFRSSAGTQAAPLPPNNGMILGVLGFRGWEGSDWGPANRARIYCIAADSWSTRPATRWGFTTSSGGGAVERLGVGAQGEITVGIQSFQIADALTGTLFLRGRPVSSLQYGIQAGALIFCNSMTAGTGPGSLAVSGGTVNKPTYFDGNSWFVM